MSPDVSPWLSAGGAGTLPGHARAATATADAASAVPCCCQSHMATSQPASLNTFVPPASWNSCWLMAVAGVDVRSLPTATAATKHCQLETTFHSQAGPSTAAATVLP
jgi:hypothetical protein